MKVFLKGLSKIVGVIVSLYLITALFAPADYKVEKSRFISTNPEYIYGQVALFQNWSNWSPWEEKDSTAVYDISGEDGKLGAKYSWTGDPELSGKGNIEIRELIENEKVGYQLIFEDWDMVSNGEIQLFPADSGTNVTWSNQGGFSFLMRPIMLFFDISSTIGLDLERGLEKIDSVSLLEMKKVNI